MFNNRIDIKGLLWLRLYLCVQVIASFGIAALDERSFANSIAMEGGPFAWSIIYIMAGLGVLGALDCLVNDILNERFNFSFGLKWRLCIFMSLAFGYAAMMYISVHAKAWSVLPFYLINVTAFVAVMVADLHCRVRPEGLERRKGDRRHAGTTA